MHMHTHPEALACRLARLTHYDVGFEGLRSGGSVCWPRWCASWARVRAPQRTTLTRTGPRSRFRAAVTRRCASQASSPTIKVDTHVITRTHTHIHTCTQIYLDISQDARIHALDSGLDASYVRVCVWGGGGGGGYTHAVAAGAVGPRALGLDRAGGRVVWVHGGRTGQRRTDSRSGAQHARRRRRPPRGPLVAPLLCTQPPPNTTQPYIHCHVAVFLLRASQHKSRP
jgi:hypothetical protein